MHNRAEYRRDIGNNGPTSNERPGGNVDCGAIGVNTVTANPFLIRLHHRRWLR